MCLNFWQLGSITSVFFLGMASTLLIVPHISNKYGRKWPFIWSLVITMCTMILILIGSSYPFLLAMMAISGMAASGRLVVGFVYTSELFVPKWKNWFGTIFVMSQAVTGITITLYFWLFPYAYWPIVVTGIIMTFLCIIVTLLIGEESVLWLLKNHKLVLAERALLKMMKINQIDCND